MSDVTGDELSSLYESIKKKQSIPNVKPRQREKFHNILEKTTVPNRSFSSRYIDSSTRPTSLNLNVTGDELSSLYRSVERKDNIPNVRPRQREKFHNILEKTRVPNRSLSSRYIDSSTELATLNSNTSHNRNKFIRVSRRNRANVFADILNATNHQNSATAGEIRNQENIKSHSSINPIEGSDTDSDHSNKVLGVHRPLLRPAYSRAEIRKIVNAFSSEDNIQQPHGTLHTDSTDSSKSTDSPKLCAKKFNSKVRRLPKINTVRQHVGLENILNPAGQSHSNDIVVSKLSSDEDDSDLSITKNRFKEKKSHKFRSNYENILATNSSKNDNPEVLSAVSSSSKKGQHRIRDKPTSASDDYENKVSSRLSKQSNLDTFQSNHRQFNIEHYFRKMPKSKVHNLNSYSNNSELVDSNILGTNRKGEDPSLVTKHPEEYYNISQFKEPRLSIENQVSKYNKSSNTKKPDDLKHLSRINDIPTAEKEQTTRNYSLSPTIDPESLIGNANSRALHTHNNEFGIDNSSSDLTFDSALVHHSTLRNTPILKPPRRSLFRKNDLHILHDLDNERHSSVKHNNEVSAESGSQYKAQPNRSEIKQLSESHLRSDTLISHRYLQHANVSKDLAKAKNQTEGDKIFEFPSSKNDLANQQTENSSQLLKLRRRAQSQLSDATGIIDNNKGVLSNMSEKSKNRHSSGKHNDVEVSAESESQNKAQPNRSETKQLSESHLRSDTLISHRYLQHTNVSKDLAKVKNQTEGNKIFEFPSSKNDLANQQTENSSQLLKLRRRAQSQLSDATGIIDNNNGLLSNVSETKRNVMGMSSHDKIYDPTSNNKGVLSNVSGSKRKVTSVVNSSGPKKSKESLPANKPTSSQESGTICNINRVPDLPSKTGGSRNDAKLRKFVVRGNNVPFKKPAEWVNTRFYNKLLPFFENKFGPLRCYKECEDKALKLHNNVKIALRKPKEQVRAVNKVRKILYVVGAIKTPMDFMLFAHDYLPNEFCLIAIPKRVGSSEMGVPYPKGIGLFDDLKLS